MDIYFPSIDYLFYLHIKRQHRHDLAALHAVEDGGVAERAAHVGGERFKGGALLGGLEARAAVVVVCEELTEKGVWRREHDAADALVGGDARELFGHFDGAIKPAELVNKAVLFALRARPDAPLSD